MQKDFASWLTGFIDGEGCFRVHKSKAGGYYACSFSLKLRDDDSPIIHSIITNTGIGYAKADASRSGNSRPCIVWTVHSKKDCSLLVELLDRYPLRSKKSRDYAIWREAVKHWCSMRRGNRWTGMADWTPMIGFKKAIEEVRAYR